MESLERRIDSLLETLEPEKRATVEKDLDELRAESALTVDRLVAVIADARATLARKRTAAWLAGQLQERRTAPALLQALGSTGDEEFAWEAAKALALIAEPQTIDPLLVLAQSHGTNWMRQAAVYALGYVGDSRIVAGLCSVLADDREDHHVRAHAAEALGNIADVRAFDTLVASLEDPAAEVRFSAVFALGQLGDVRALGPLKRLAEHDGAVASGGTVQGEAKEAIRQLGLDRQ